MITDLTAAFIGSKPKLRWTTVPESAWYEIQAVSPGQSDWQVVAGPCGRSAAVVGTSSEWYGAQDSQGLSTLPFNGSWRFRMRALFEGGKYGGWSNEATAVCGQCYSLTPMPTLPTNVFVASEAGLCFAQLAPVPVILRTAPLTQCGASVRLGDNMLVTDYDLSDTTKTGSVRCLDAQTFAVKSEIIGSPLLPAVIRLRTYGSLVIATSLMASGGYGAVTLLDASEPSNLRLLGQITPPLAALGNHPQDALTDGTTLFVAVNGGQYLVTYDIANPSAPVYLDALRAHYVGEGPTAMVLDGPWLWVAHDGCVAQTLPGGITTDGGEIIAHDVSNPCAPQVVGLCWHPQMRGINALSRYGQTLYAVTEAGVFLTVSVSDPVQPIVMGWAADNRLRYGADVLAADNGCVYVAAGAGVVEIDVSKPSAPIVVGLLNLPGIIKARSLSR